MFFLLLFVWLLGVVSGIGGLAFGAVYMIKQKLAIVEGSLKPSESKKVELFPIETSSLGRDENQDQQSSSGKSSPRLGLNGNNNNQLDSLDESSFYEMKDDKKKKEREKSLDPIAMAIKNKKAGKMIVTTQEETLKSGWLKIRGTLNVWWNRWVVLKPGKLIYYQSEKKEDCFGIVVLNGCVIEERKTDKKGYCFVITHPQKKAIYSDKGLKGETLKSAKFPGNSFECIVRSADESEGKMWKEMIQKAIQMGSSQEFQLQTISDNSNTSLSSTSYSSSNPPPLPPKPSSILVNPSDSSDSKPKMDSESETLSSLLQRTSSLPSISSLHSSIDKGNETSLLESHNNASMPDISASESESEDLVDLKEEERKNLLDSIEPSMTPSESIDIPKQNISRNFTSQSLPPVLSKDITSSLLSSSPSGNVTSSSPSGAVNNISPTNAIPVTATVIIPSTIVEIPGDYPISQSVPAPRKEGWLELKTIKGYKSFFFTLRSGLLTFFENEKSIDCVGIVDLEDCHVSQNSEGGFQITGSGKKQNIYIPNEDGGHIQDHPFIYGIVLRNEEIFVSNEWIRLLEEEIPKVHRSSPLVLPRLPNFVGEKSHWFNIALTQIFQKHLQPSTALQFKLKAVLMKKFERIKRPDYLGEINIEDIYLGDDMFHFQEVSCYRTPQGELVGEADVNYNGKFSLKLSTQISILGVTVPVIVSVKLMKLTGRAVLYNSPEIASRFAMAFVELPDTKFDVQLVVGQRTRLDVNKYFSIASDWLVTMLKKLIFRNMVAPNRVTFTLPIPGKKFSISTIQLTSRSKVKNAQVPSQLNPVPQTSAAFILEPK
eukprot:TRINITY_DN3027_c0_g1_i1.p1 TRINITY_DN3027_c0_g1~~TRINITY_DN3027_c0_g1_i1.p1  ORF type:complete len:827 (-),score=301.29 TRINITY_DN3027_c0_g1_i1:36-2516(-)